MKNERLTTAVFDAKPHDQRFLPAAEGAQQIDFRYFNATLTPETLALAKGFPALVAFVNDHLDAPQLKALKAGGCRHVALRCAGFNKVDLKAAKKLGITVTRVPAYSPHAVAEHAVALTLCLNRKIHRAYQRVREQNFSLDGLMGFDLHGKTVGIVGTGRIGRITAQIFRGFGCQVLACDPKADKAWAKRHAVRYAALERLLEESDVVSLHAPLTPGTEHLINAHALARMKEGALLVNTGRGALVDSGALIQALKKGRLGGVALDVYEEEEGVFFENLSERVLQDDVLARLLGFPHVLLTSHQAFFTREALQAIAQTTVTNLLRIAARKPALKGTQLA